ncbi:hypothetical protein IMG5_101760, partial [Ichthyophthirius multifiliis]
MELRRSKSIESPQGVFDNQLSKIQSIIINHPQETQSEQDFQTNSRKIIYKDQIFDKYLLSPIEKYEKYGRFPYKLIVHISIVILTTFQIIYSSNNLTTNSTEQNQAWRQLFFGKNYSMNIKNSDNESQLVYFDTLPQFSKHLQNLFSNINLSNDNRIQDYYFNYTSSNFQVYYNYPLNFTEFENKKQFKYNVDLKVGILQPFNQSNTLEIKQILKQAKFYELSINDVILAKYNVISCWNFLLQYSLHSKNVIKANLISDGGPCNQQLYEEGIKMQGKDYMSQYFQIDLVQPSNLLYTGYNTTVNILSLLCSFYSVILCYKYILQIMNIYIEIQENSQRQYLKSYSTEYLETKKIMSRKRYNLLRILTEQKQWHELTFYQKLQYFDGWYFIILVGNFFQIIGSMFLLTLTNQKSDFYQSIQIIDWTIGLGAFCAWISLLKYLEYSQKASINLDVILFSLPQIFAILVEFIPVFMVFVIVGLTCFSKCELFSDTRSAIITLISLIYMDSIYYDIQY